VIAYLPQLDYDVPVETSRSPFLNGGFLEELPVNLLLKLSDSNIDVDLDFGRQILFDFLLDPSEEEGPEDLVELLDYLLVLLLSLQVCHLVFAFSKIEPFVEVFS